MKEDHPSTISDVEAAALSKQAGLLRNKIAAAESGLFVEAADVVDSYRTQLAYVEAKLEKYRAREAPSKTSLDGGADD